MSEPPDVVVKDSEIVQTLGEYDMVVLSEPKSPSSDKQARKANTTPLYVNALLESKTPFTTILFGNPYTDSMCPFMWDILDAPNCGQGGFLITISESAVASNPRFEKFNWKYLRMPYDPKFDVDAEHKRTGIMGSVGRVIYNKGQHVSALACTTIPDATLMSYEMWGASSVGRGPNPTFIVYEFLQQKRGGVGQRQSRTEGPSSHGGDVISPMPWWLDMPNGLRISYNGNYSDQAETCSRLDVCAGLTSATFSSDVEYTTFEAMDAGCIYVAGRHMTHPAYNIFVPETFHEAPSLARIEKGAVDEVIADVRDTMLRALTLDDESRRAVVRHNRLALRAQNDPATFAQELIASAVG